MIGVFTWTETKWGAEALVYKSKNKWKLSKWTYYVYIWNRIARRTFSLCSRMIWYCAVVTWQQCFNDFNRIEVKVDTNIIFFYVYDRTHLHRTVCMHEYETNVCTEAFMAEMWCADWSSFLRNIGIYSRLKPKAERAHKRNNPARKSVKRTAERRGRKAWTKNIWKRNWKSWTHRMAIWLKKYE